MLTNNDLLVLGLLLDRPMHGYEIGQYVKAEGVMLWFDISTAAIYYSLNKLRRQGLISETQRGGKGEKSVYHATEKGREQFFACMEEALASREPVHFEYDLGIFLLNKLPQERALALLEHRMDFLRERQQTLEKGIEKERSSRNALRLAILEHSASYTGVEIQWLSSIVQHLRGEDGEGDEYRGLMILSGDLHEFHLPDLIKLVASGEHSGTLSVTDGVNTRTLSFHQGRPVCATAEQQEGEISDREKVLESIFDLFRWQEGEFTFNQRMKPQKGCTTLDMSADDLILAGSRWVDNWVAIQQVVASPETVFEHRDGQVDPGELALTESERDVFEALDGLRDVSDVARVCGLTEFETSKILYGLCTVGLAQPGDLGKIRLRRVFREYAELMCRGTIPYRDSPDDFTCEAQVNDRCADIPVRFVAGRIEDQTDPGLRTEELADVYRRFLRTQRDVVGNRFGHDVAKQLCSQVLTQISPSLREALDRYELVDETPSDKT